MVDVEGDDMYVQPHVRFAPSSARAAVKTEDSSPEDQKISGTKRPRGDSSESSSDPSPGNKSISSALSPGRAAAFDGLDIEEDLEIHDDHIQHANVHRQGEGESRSSGRGESPRKREYSSRSA